MDVCDWSTDAGVTDWVVDRLSSSEAETTVRSIVPDGFVAYARLLHPFRRVVGRRERVRWKELACARGIVLRASTRHEELSGASRGLEPPLSGPLHPVDLDVLLEGLAHFTAKRERCWFGYWSGYGWAPRHGVMSHRTRRGTPDRPVLVRSGFLDGATDLLEFPICQSPNIWWPDSREWIVVSEIDFASTYVGGPAALIDLLVNDDRLEAIAVESKDSITD